MTHPLNHDLKQQLARINNLTPPREHEREDPTIGNETFIRGIPLVGHVPGAINGTRPGDSAHRLALDDSYLRPIYRTRTGIPRR